MNPLKLGDEISFRNKIKNSSASGTRKVESMSVMSEPCITKGESKKIAKAKYSWRLVFLLGLSNRKACPISKTVSRTDTSPRDRNKKGLSPKKFPINPNKKMYNTV